MLSGARRLLHNFKYTKKPLRIPKVTDMSRYVSPYQAIRDRLDYKYHEDPTPARKVVQDAFMSQHLSGPYIAKPHPVLLFTAGAMGAGKSHYLSTLPFKFILIDPDEIAANMPGDESVCPVHNSSAPDTSTMDQGTRLRHEARMITEVLLYAAMERSYDIVIDGSLRSYQWYLRQLPEIRGRFRHYRVELVHIHAPLSEVLQRAKKREGTTGRNVPSSLIERSWKDSRRAISILGRKKIVDRVQMVDSSGQAPILIYDSDKDPEWEYRGVPNELSRVDGFLEGGVVENGEDIIQGKQSLKL